MILKYDFREILIFSAYEKEIFFLSYLLKCKTKLKVSLIPSPNPISLHYKAVICDVFNFTAPFQPKELKKNGFEWHVTNTQMWPPHGAERIGLNKDSTRVDKFKIGFMSSGMALRQHLKHTNITGNSDYFAEDAAVKSLKQYMQKTGDAVIVYFHPLEKASPENIAFSENFYRNAFGNNVEFAPYDRPSKQNFHLCDVAIAGFSSVQIERLYGGYKTLFAPMGFLKNYFGDDRLDAVSANSDEELVKLLEECKKINADVFFEKFGLKEYRWDSYEVKFPSEV